MSEPHRPIAQNEDFCALTQRVTFDLIISLAWQNVMRCNPFNHVYLCLLSPYLASPVLVWLICCVSNNTTFLSFKILSRRLILIGKVLFGLGRFLSTVISLKTDIILWYLIILTWAVAMTNVQCGCQEISNIMNKQDSMATVCVVQRCREHSAGFWNCWVLKERKIFLYSWHYCSVLYSDTSHDPMVSEYSWFTSISF